MKLNFNLKEETVVFKDISDGDRISVSGAFTSSSTEIFIESEEDDIDCELHTSCSVPIVVGDSVGPFMIMGAPQSSCESTGGDPRSGMNPPYDPCDRSGKSGKSGKDGGKDGKDGSRDRRRRLGKNSDVDDEDDNADVTCECDEGNP
jgi:hypothetical protein